MNEDYERYIVTSDLNQLATLRSKADELDSFALGDLAISLGLHPPGYIDGERHAITQYGPPGHEGPPLLVWSIGLWSPNPDDLAEEDDDEGGGDALWGEIGVSIADPAKPDAEGHSSKESPRAPWER